MNLETYIITAAQGEAKPNTNFLTGLEHLADKYSAKLKVIPIAGKNVNEVEMDEALKPYLQTKVFQRLNSNVQIRDIVVPSQNKDPTTGKRDLVGKYGSSIIFGHSKQRYQAVPTFNAGLPRYLYTTGAVTEPRYRRTNHRGDTAFREHQLGALIVEVRDKQLYNVRNIRAMKNGKFVDMGVEYDGIKEKKMEVDSIVIGDTHWTSHDKRSHEVMYEMIDYFNPKNVFLHDFFDGSSINHHEDKSTLLRARKMRNGQLNLQDELASGSGELCKMGLKYPKTAFNLVASNHHRFLRDYIEDPTKWGIRDLQNAEIGSYLFNQAVTNDEDNIDDIQYLIKTGYEKYNDLSNNVHFLKYDDSIRHHGFQLASHGDKGANGARGGTARARSVTGGGKSITGHSHTMEIYGDTYIVGTSSNLNQSYTSGSANAQIGANAILYKNGMVQMLPIIEGRWK